MGMGEYQAAGVKKGSRMDTMHKQGYDICTDDLINVAGSHCIRH